MICNLRVISNIFTFLQRRHIQFPGHQKLFLSKISLLGWWPSAWKIAQSKDPSKIDENSRKNSPEYFHSQHIANQLNMLYWTPSHSQMIPLFVTFMTGAKFRLRENPLWGENLALWVKVNSLKMSPK